MQKYEILNHIADLKIKSFGKDISEVFINMALGLASQQAGTDELEKLGVVGEWEQISLESDKIESLFVDWLNEIIYRSEVNKKIYAEIEVLKFTEASFKIISRIRGAAVEQKSLEIKAATYHELKIKRVDGGWEAIVVFDI